MLALEGFQGVDKLSDSEEVLLFIEMVKNATKVEGGQGSVERWFGKKNISQNRDLVFFFKRFLRFRR